MSTLNAPSIHLGYSAAVASWQPVPRNPPQTSACNSNLLSSLGSPRWARGKGYGESPQIHPSGHRDSDVLPSPIPAPRPYLLPGASKPHPPGTSVTESNGLYTGRPCLKLGDGMKVEGGSTVLLRQDPYENASPYVMWVGNVSSTATEDELWRFFSQPPSTRKFVLPFSRRRDSALIPSNNQSFPDSGISSIRLISHSATAFVNYASLKQLRAAVSRFSGKWLRKQDELAGHLPLTCRIRRPEEYLRAGVHGQRGTGMHIRWILDHFREGRQLNRRPTDYGEKRYTDQFPPLEGSIEQRSKPPMQLLKQRDSVDSLRSVASTSSAILSKFFPRRYFILKAFDEQILECSLSQSKWSTQPHNEIILDQAYRTSEEVYLIFSINKSGEFYGFARMAGLIFGQIDSSEDARSRIRRTSTSSVTSPRALVRPYRPPNRRSRSQQALQIVAPSEATVTNPTTDPPGGAYVADPSQLFHDSLRRTRSFELFSNVDLEWSDSQSGDEDEDDATTADFLDAPDYPALVQTIMSPASSPTTLTNSRFGTTFSITWITTTKLPFHRCNRLRNPWNRNRQIKVCRDGTELEPRVAEELLDEWTRYEAEVVDLY